MTVVLSTAYFPPVTWFSVLSGSNEALIEKCEHFKKQTYRNRCEILSSNGKLPLTVPLERSHSSKTLIDRIKIDYSSPWQRIHLQAIRSAYGKTPYFIHYFDIIQDIINTKYETVWELNTKTIFVFTEMFGLSFPGFTSDFVNEYESDFRNVISPKNTGFVLSEKEYFQAFLPKFGFVPGLSVLDLLFNHGPDSVNYIKRKTP